MFLTKKSGESFPQWRPDIASDFTSGWHWTFKLRQRISDRFHETIARVCERAIKIEEYVDRTSIERFLIHDSFLIPLPPHPNPLPRSGGEGENSFSRLGGRGWGEGGAVTK